jgi:hypothetical protein
MSDAAFISTNKILITEEGIIEPAFNQRNAYIELLTGKQSLQLTEDGLKEITNE